MNTPFTLKHEAGAWIAHAVALDLVAVDIDKQAVLIKLKTLCIAQVGFGLKHGGAVRNSYFAAPPAYWKAPFYFLEFDPGEYLTWRETLTPSVQKL